MTAIRLDGSKGRNRGALPLRWIILAFLAVNALLVVYVHNVATSCGTDHHDSTHGHGPHHPFLPNKAGSLPLTAASMSKPTSTSASTTGSSRPNTVKTFQKWLEDHPDTPGATFVRLLQEHLFVSPDAEAARLAACHDKNYPLCFGGHNSFNRALQNVPADKNGSMVYLEHNTRIPLYEHEKDITHFIWQLRRYGPIESQKKLRIIHNLGTDPVCLPLLLAGASVSGQGVLVELGTYVGLSSRCLAHGLGKAKAAINATSEMESSYHAFDVFGHDARNFEKIGARMPWVKEVDPNFSEDSSYRWLWDAAVKDVYPNAVGHEGLIDADSLYPKLWHKRPVQVLSVDSAKSWGAFRDQTAGIQKPYMLKRGALLILMDFATIDTQIKLLYSGCLRQYIQPVYSSFCQGEQWIFVVTQSFSLGMIGACLEDYLDGNQVPTEAQFEAMMAQATEDVEFMDGLFGQTSPAMAKQRTCLLDKVREELNDAKVHWKYLQVQ